MAGYLLQAEENKGQHFACPGDVVVSEDLRAVYRIAKDGSRRRVKNKGEARFYVNDVEQRLQAQAKRESEAAAQRKACQTVISGDQEELRQAVAAMLPLLSGGRVFGIRR